MSTWNELIATGDTGNLTYTFPTFGQCTLRSYIQLTDCCYDTKKIIDLIGDITISLQGDGNVFQLLEGTTVLIDNITIAKNEWIDMVVVIKNDIITLYLNNILIGATSMSVNLNFTTLTLYGNGAQLYDELIFIEHAVTSNKIAFWYNQTETPVSADPGATGPVGEPGATGPAGNPGMLGLWSSGDYLYLDGFKDDGEIGNGFGYAYINGIRQSIVAHNDELSSTGMGYVIYNPSWSPTVQFVKIIPDSGVVAWKDYNTSSITYSKTGTHVLGKFNRSSTEGIKDMTIINPIMVASFEVTNFMGIMADSNASGDFDSFATWADAMGVSQIFESLAVWGLFANLIEANKLRVGGGTEENGFLFKAEMVNGQAIIEAWYDGEKVFGIDGNTGAVEISGTGKFGGEIESDPLTTKEYLAGTAIPVTTLIKIIYSVAELKTKVVVTTTPTTLAGSFDGITISKGCFRATAGKLSYGGNSFSVTSLTSTSAEQTNSYTIPTMLGSQKLIITASKTYSSGRLLVNGVAQTWDGYALSKTIDYHAGDIILCGATRRTTHRTEHRYTKLYYKCYRDWSWNLYSTTTTSWSSVSRTTGASLPSDPEAGDTFSIYTNEQTHIDTNYYSNSVSVTLAFESTLSYNAGFVFISNLGVYKTLEFLEGFLKESDYPITLGTWVGSSNKDYISGTDFYTAFDSLTLGVNTPCTGSITYGTEGVASVTESVIYVTKGSTSIMFQKTNGTFVEIKKWGGNGSLDGSYSALSWSITPTFQISEVLFNNLNPKTAISTIGKDTTAGKITNYYGVNVNATTLNSSGSSNKVYGKTYAT